VAEDGDPAVLRDWIARGRPLIVRRPGLSADGTTVSLGLARPGRRRLACRAAVSAITEFLPPPVWTDARFAPFRPRLFGSHAWQLLAGIPYVTAASDVDLCVDIQTVAEWDAFRATAAAADGALDGSPRLDLEIVFRGDAAFVWREYLSGAREVLVKSHAGVRLHPRDHLADLLA
jgi:phosphoribosyl-dephospho-CoA transferase